MSILKVENLKFSYGENDLFNNVNFDLHLNDHLGLVGANGSGKNNIFKFDITLKFILIGSITWNNS